MRIFFFFFLICIASASGNLANSEQQYENYRSLTSKQRRAGLLSWWIETFDVLSVSCDPTVSDMIPLLIHGIDVFLSLLVSSWDFDNVASWCTGFKSTHYSFLKSWMFIVNHCSVCIIWILLLAYYEITNLISSHCYFFFSRWM